MLVLLEQYHAVAGVWIPRSWHAVAAPETRQVRCHRSNLPLRRFHLLGLGESSSYAAFKFNLLAKCPRRLTTGAEALGLVCCDEMPLTPRAVAQGLACLTKRLKKYLKFIHITDGVM
ncbi:hypothetical protein EJB05_04838, partial [Eragrostis curvula]